MDLNNRRLLRLPQVLELVGSGRSTLYAMVDRGEFPPPVRIGARAVAWRARDVQAWLENRPPAGPRCKGA